jgi:hypothetical protein
MWMLTILGVKEKNYIKIHFQCKKLDKKCDFLRETRW